MSDRKLWFITRPERDPKFHQDALLALQEATENFTVKWHANRAVQKTYEKKLNQFGLKRDNISNDGSGGRTWAAMLKTFAYCYTNDEGFLVPTKVGEALLEGKKIRENIQKQIMTFQIPNAYFMETGFRPKFDENFKIRPTRFLIRLTNQPELNFYLTKEEITFFALKAKSDQDLQSVTKEILEYRTATTEEKAEVRQAIAAEYDHRDRSDHGARDFYNAHSDVAHTFMLICEYTELVEYMRGDSLRVNPNATDQVKQKLYDWDARYPFNSRYKISLELMAESNGLDVDRYKASSYHKISPATNKQKTTDMVKKLLEPYPVPEQLGEEKIIAILSERLSKREAESYAAQFASFEYGHLQQEFVESYIGQMDHRRFEDQTGEIFKAIGFDVEMRPKPRTNDRTEIEIMLKYGDKKCGIIDAKNYRSDKFQLSATFRSHMGAEYIPNYEGASDNREVHFFGYVTADKFSGENGLFKISEMAKRVIGRTIPGIMLNARVLVGFLDYCLENEITKQRRVELFLTAVDNSGYHTLPAFLKVVERFL